MKNRQKKSGFTLVELMVVAIIVAILAAVAIPLMTGNKDRAIATEGQAGCTTIATQLRMYWAEHGEAASSLDDLQGIKTGDLNGSFFADGSYSFEQTDGDSYVITGAVSGEKAGTANQGKTVVMNVTDGETDWDQSSLLYEQE